MAHYDKDLSWLLPYADHCHVYHKGGSKGSEAEIKFKKWDTLPNVGRESHTYLHHIINNYHCLADVTLFVQGEVSDHIQWSDHALKSYLK